MPFALRLVGTWCLIAVVWSALGARAAEETKDQPQAEPKSKPAHQELSLGQIVLKGPLSEAPQPPGLFGELEVGLPAVLKRLDKAASDPKISGLILRIQNPVIGRGKVHELREAIARVRKADKKVYAQLEMAQATDYLVATACDEIVMPPSGTLFLLGVRAEVSFYKGLFDMVGIQPDFMQVGDYKGAAEPYSRTSSSPQFKAEMEKLLDDQYEQLVATIAASRDLAPQRVREILDEGVFAPHAAKEAGLIDHVAYEDRFQEQLRDQLDTKKLELVRGYGKRKLDTDFSGFAGMVKMMNLLVGPPQRARRSDKPKIAVVYAVGIIMPGKSSDSLLGPSFVGSDTIVKAIRKAADDPQVSAIVLRVDSPGGSALASDLIWREVVRTEKPVIASMSDTAASGGYYISMGADKILAEPGTLTGSIGVVGGKLALKGLYEKIGITTEVYGRGKNSGLFSMTTPFSDSEREAWKRMMNDIYGQFSGKAAQGRDMTDEQLEPLAQGRLWTGRMAAENGLVDGLGTLEDAIAEAKTAAGMQPDDDVDLLVLPKPKNFFESLFEGLDPSARFQTAFPELSQQLGEVEVLRRLSREPVLTLMPFRVQFK